MPLREGSWQNARDPESATEPRQARVGGAERSTLTFPGGRRHRQSPVLAPDGASCLPSGTPIPTAPGGRPAGPRRPRDLAGVTHTASAPSRPARRA